MAQNTSPAVMQQRHEARESLDDFPTPPWATRALIEHMSAPLPLASMTVREPAAGRGYMAATLAEEFVNVEASDIHDYGVGLPVADYLFGDTPKPVDLTITNPPFRLAEQFIARALETSTKGVAIFARTTFVEGQGRFRDLFSKRPPSVILHFAERVPLFKGCVRDPEVSYWNPKANKGLGAMVKPTTATAYSWFIWQAGADARTSTGWIAPCRERLTRPGDYATRGKPPEDAAPPAEHTPSNWQHIGDVSNGVVDKVRESR